MKIRFHRKFKKQFKKLDKKIQRHFEARLELFMENPSDYQLNNHALTGEYQGHRSINITGNYRAIFTEYSDKLIIFVAIGTHPKLYK